MKSPIHLSASKIDTFYNCPRLYQYKYVLNLKEPPKKSFLIGNVTHSALEYFHKSYVNKKTSKAVMGSAFKKSMSEYKSKAPGLDKNDIMTIKGMLQDYLYYLSPRSEPKVIGTEKYFKIQLGDGISMGGKIDRIDRYGDKLYIVDYKTSFAVYSRKEMAASTQLVIYAHWAQQEFNVKEIYGVYIFLKHVLNGGVQKMLIDSDPDSLKSKCEAIRDRVESDDFPKNKSFRWCGKKYCSFYDRCVKEK